MKPQRIQLSRRAGFNLQAVSLALNGLPAVNCARPSEFGNPFLVRIDGDAAECVARFKTWIEGNIWTLPNKQRIKDVLRGKNLACWCHIWQCPKCKRYADTWPDSTGPNCACGMGESGPGSIYTTMLRVPCHCDILLAISNEGKQVVHDHRNGEIIQPATDIERAKRGLPVPWKPEYGETETRQPDMA